jgi:ABC-type bacteriocin/lantibiotic exporter with double-glycine peptidase domain
MLRGVARTLLLSLALALVPACRTRPPLLSDQAVVLALPLVQQDELWECGLVAITALAGYYGVELEPARRVELAATALEREGLSGAELRAALEAQGFRVFVFEDTLTEGATGLYTHVDAGRPPLVMVSDDGELHHYCLVLGYDPPAGHVVLLDPRRGRVVLPEESFERAWARSSRFTLLAVPLVPVEPVELDARAGPAPAGARGDGG